MKSDPHRVRSFGTGANEFVLLDRVNISELAAHAAAIKLCNGPLNEVLAFRLKVVTITAVWGPVVWTVTGCIWVIGGQWY